MAKKRMCPIKRFLQRRQEKQSKHQVNHQDNEQPNPDVSHYVICFAKEKEALHPDKTDDKLKTIPEKNQE